MRAAVAVMSQYEIGSSDEAVESAAPVPVPLPALAHSSSKSIFERFDRDGNGVIDANELKELCRALGRELSATEESSALTRLDSDGDGTVSLDEFSAWWEAGGSLELLVDAPVDRWLRHLHADPPASEPALLASAGPPTKRQRINMKATLAELAAQSTPLTDDQLQLARTLCDRREGLTESVAHARQVWWQ